MASNALRSPPRSRARVTASGSGRSSVALSLIVDRCRRGRLVQVERAATGSVARAERRPPGADQMEYAPGRTVMGSLGQRDGLGGRGLRAAALGALLLSTPAYAQSTAPPSPTAEARKDAARRYAEGTRAFDARDFTRAGEAFDAAYALAPHPDALWNSARAWHSAGELARAANLYARYLREARRDAPDRPGALAAQKQLASRLGRIEIHPGEGVQNVRVDDVPVEGTVVYV